MTRSWLERTIHFYCVDVGRDDANDLCPFDFQHLLAEIAALEFTLTDVPSRYEWESADSRLCAFFDPPDARDALIFCRSRHSEPLQLERQGEITNLELEQDQGVLDGSHVVFFPDNVVGIEYNRYAPDATKLGWYLTAKSKNFLRPVELHHLMRTDPADRLAGLRDLREIEIEVRSPFVAIVQNEAPSLGKVLDGVREAAGGGRTVRAILSFPEETRKSAFDTLTAPLRRLLQRPDIADNAIRFKVRGTHQSAGKLEPIDLLADKIITKKQISRAQPGGRTVDSQSAFAEIRKAYAELLPDIKGASSVVFR